MCLEMVDNVVDALGELADVLGVDSREHTDAQLVTAELAVGLSVEHTVGAQCLGDSCSVDLVVEVDGAHYQ